MSVGERGLQAVWWWLLLILLPAACTEQTNPIGFDRASRDLSLGPPETLLVAAPLADVESRPPRTTGSSVSLLVGSDAELEAAALIRFEALPDTTGLRYAYLQLHAKKGRGEGIYLRVYEVDGGTEAWSATDVTWESRPDTLAEPLSETSVPARTGALEASEVDTIPRIEIPIALIRRWKEDPESNAGIQISLDWGEVGRGIARIVSHNDMIHDSDGREIPTPALVFADSAHVEVGSVEATGDAYIYRDKRPPPSGADSLANVSGGPPARFILRFDLESLPAEASVVRAVLSLPIEAGQFSAEEGVQLAVYETTEAWDEESIPDSLAVASTAVFLETFSDTTATRLEMELGVLVQSWIEGEENHGVTVRFADETAAPRGIRLFTREARETPSLRIVYMRPLDFRWGEASR